MTPEQAEDLVSNLLRVKRTGKKYFFYAVAKAEDGEPALLVQRKEGPLKKAAKLVRKTAKAKIGARGHVQMSEDKTLRFVMDEGSLKGEKLRKLLALKLAKDDGLKKVGRLLRQSEVLDADTYASMLSEGTITEREDSESSGFDALYEQAESLLAVVSAALSDHGTFGPKVKEQLVFLHRAGDIAEGGDDKEATAIVERILKTGPAMLGSAWKVESERVKKDFVTVRGKLAEAHGGESTDEYAKAYKPLETLQKLAVGHKKAQKWQLALETLQELADKLDDVAYPEPSESDDLSAIEKEIDALGDLSELDDSEPLEDFSEVTQEELQRLTACAQADALARKAQRRAHKGLTAFLDALRSDTELMDALDMKDAFLTDLYSLLPDLSGVYAAILSVMSGHGDAKAYATLGPAIQTAFEPLDSDMRLSAFESTDLGSFEIATPLEDARKDLLALLT